MKKLMRLLTVAGLLYAANRWWNGRFEEASITHSVVEDREGRRWNGRIVRVQSLLNASPQFVWRKLRAVETLSHVSAPILYFQPQTADPLPEKWLPGDSITVDLFALGFLPVGSHTIALQAIDDAAMTMRTMEHGVAAQVWNHQITVADAGDGRARYSDEVGIYAGALTPLIAAFAHFFYRWRQTRWRGVVQRARG